MDDQGFSSLARGYRALGYWPRPVKPGTKRPPIKDWEKPDDQIPPDELERWQRQFPSYGIGLLMGSPFPDGTTLGALDVDHDHYVRIATALLGNPVCGRIGKKGIVYFVRIKGVPKYIEFKPKGDGGKPTGKVAELLAD